MKRHMFLNKKTPHYRIKASVLLNAAIQLRIINESLIAQRNSRSL